jgi:CheY-like chemotaxis protein
VASPSILIVDDEYGLAEMLREMLRESGYEVILAINGRLALDILSERQIDLVITDMMMPVMDGAELAAALRNSATHRTIPIIMMTSLPSVAPRHQQLFNAVLRKPFTPDLLMTALHGCLAGPARAGDDAADEPAPGRQPSSPTTTPPG